MTQTYKKLLRIAMIALCVCLSMSGVGFAQTITGSVSGTVTDPSGAAVKGASVNVTNVDTGVSVSDTTNSSGIYNVRFLQIGKYTVTTTSAGFDQQTYGPFALEIGQVAKVDVALTVGKATTAVDVSTTLTPLLNTENGTLATTLTASTIGNIPMNGGNWSSLSLFVPGAVSTNPSTFGGSGNVNSIERNQNGGGASQASVNGNRAEGNNYRLDGIEINETLNNLVGYNPNPDALGEVQIISANAPAEYGNVNGGDVVAVTKSGTNQYHGSAGVSLENYQLDANTWNHKNVPAGTTFTPRSTYTQTQYSGTLGGPIIKDKLFAFGDYFGTRYHTGGSSTATVLSALMRQGDFSELLNPAIMCSSTGGTCASQNKLKQLYDPANGYAPYVGNKGVPITSAAVQFLISHPEIYPLPNIAPGADSPVVDNYRAATSQKIYNNQFDIKVDYTPTKNDRISVRYLQGKSGDTQTKALPVQFASASVYPDKGIAINYVRTITPSIINELRAGFTRVTWEQGNPLDITGVFGTKGNSLLGIPGSQAFSGFSALNIDGITDANIGNSAVGTNFNDNSFDYGDNLTWQRGKHLLKFGAEVLRYQQNNYYPGNDGALGRFDYGQDNNGNTISFTSNPNITSTTVPSATGYAYADFVLDRAAFEGVGGIAGKTGQRQYRTAYFVQDDWKFAPNLTFNIGLRYEYFQPIYEVNNKEVNVNLTNGTLMFAGAVPAGQPAGSTTCPTRACYNATYNNFMPRLGFSYQPMTRLVIRGGFGITKALEGTGANLRLTYNPPFQSAFEQTGVAPSTSSTGVYFQSSNGFVSTNPNFGSGFYRSQDPSIKPQATNEYNLTTEYQLSNVSTIRIGYVGESSQHLIQAVAANQLRTPCIGADGTVDTNYTDAACQISDPAPFQALVGQAGGLFETASEGAANYNALQVSYRQRTYKGLEYTVNYTYARAMTNAVGFFGISGVNGPSPYAQNAYDNHAEYGPAGSDVRHALNGTAVYELPFGRGRQFASNSGYLLNEVVGGWKLSMTAVAYSGAPVTINAANGSTAGTGNKTLRPNQTGHLAYGHHSAENWWGANYSQAVTVYTQPANGTYGNARVGSERGPGYQQYDFSLFKDFTIFRENKLGFRADAFNAFNITGLGAPDNNIGDTTFGKISSVRSPQRQIQFSAKYQF